jgi:tetratricopeptide (TPR) repeat protein
LAISGKLPDLTKRLRIRTTWLCRVRALLMVALACAGNLGAAQAGRDDALLDAIAGAFTPAQMSALIASASGAADPRSDQTTQSLNQLQQLLGVSSDVVLALLRNLDRPDIRPEQSAQALAQSAIQYHAVTDQLAAITSEDAEGRSLVTQAQAAMTAGHFGSTEMLLRQLEDHEVAFSGEIAAADQSPNRAAKHTSSAMQHLIRAAQARTLLGEIALMKLRYGEATDYFQLAQQRLASLPAAELSSAELRPVTPASDLAVPGREGVIVDRPDATRSRLLAADTAPIKSDGTLIGAETQPLLPQRELEPPDRPLSVQAPPQLPIDQVRPSREQGPPTPAPAAIAVIQLGAVEAAAPHGPTGQSTGLPSVAAISKVPSASPALSADIVTLLLSRGDALLALGDVSSARLLYQRAAAEGDGRAATGMGKTYDPLFLSAIRAHGIQADPVAATTWYRKAIGLGDGSAAERLKRLNQGSDR